MTVTDRGGDAATSPLAASVGLVDADLVAMYRVVALARAVDERMWILNRAGRGGGLRPHSTIIITKGRYVWEPSS